MNKYIGKCTVFICLMLGFIVISCKDEPESKMVSFDVINNSDEIVFLLHWRTDKKSTESISVDKFFSDGTENNSIFTLYPGYARLISLHTAGYNHIRESEDRVIIYALKFSTLDRYTKQEIIDQNISDAHFDLTLDEVEENNITVINLFDP